MKSHVPLDYNNTFKKAERLYQEKKLDQAGAVYMELLGTPFQPYCYYRLADISNQAGDPLAAYDLYYKALEAKPDIFSVMLGESHSNKNYIFKGKKQETEIQACPLCASEGKPYWCYPLPEGAAYVEELNPIRLWLHCESCHHLFAAHFPDRLFEMVGTPIGGGHPGRSALYSQILSRIRLFNPGWKLFDVGVGFSECALTAREFGYDVFGIDVIDQHVQRANEYGLRVEKHDFVEMQTEETWDVIIMGDVIEHVTDPVLSIEKAYKLLNPGGVLWISTPNFESTFTTITGHTDPMRRECAHLNYFSRQSLLALLERFDFTPVDYQVSAYYNGSMEVISVKGEV